MKSIAKITRDERSMLLSCSSATSTRWYRIVDDDDDGQATPIVVGYSILASNSNKEHSYPSTNILVITLYFHSIQFAPSVALLRPSAKPPPLRRIGSGTAPGSVGVRIPGALHPPLAALVSSIPQYLCEPSPNPLSSIKFGSGGTK